MRKLAIVAILAGMAVLAGCKGGDAKSPQGGGQLLTDEDKTIYAMGVMLGGNVKTMSLTPEQIETMTKGFKDAALGKTPEVDPQSMAAQIQEFARSRATAAAETEKKKSADYLAQAAGESGAVKTDSGIIYKSLTPGTGDSPKPNDTVKVHYTGKLVDGSVFDSSVQRGQPAEFALTGVIRCWTEGLQRMKVGEKAQLVCPSDLAYGDQGRPPRIPGGATLVFEVELLEIKK
jgi:FKBP-type peptidyl-prolyl cis-trans isomerase FkpA